MRLFTFSLAVVLALASVSEAQVARIRGTVRTDQGEPVKGAVVTARSAMAQPNEFTSSTNDKGEWAMLGLRSGIWSIAVTADGFETAQGDVRVSSFDRSRSFDFVLAPVRQGSGGRIDAAALQADLKVADDHAAAARWAEAIDAYRAVLRKVPALTSVYLPLGRACREAGRHREAVEAFKTYLELHPGHQTAFVELGRTYLATSDAAAALAALTSAVEADPSSTAAATARTLLEQIKK